MLGKNRRVSVRLAGLALVLSASLAVSSGVASAARTDPSPPGGVFTCEWIAAHPVSAAKARVTCDLATFLAAAPPAISGTVLPFSQGCASVPSSGSVGQGVFAWSSYQYSTFWGWYAFSSPANYTWYVQTSGGSTQAWGNVTDPNNHNVGVPGNIYRWGAQNHSGTAQSWYVCWNDS